MRPDAIGEGEPDRRFDGKGPSAYTVRQSGRRHRSLCACGWQSDWMLTAGIAGAAWDVHALECQRDPRGAEQEEPAWVARADRLLAVLDAGDALVIPPDMSVTELDALLDAHREATRPDRST